MFSQPMAVTDHSTWHWICLNIQPKVRTMSAVTSAATTRNVLAVWVCSYFFDSYLTFRSDQRYKLTWGANFHEYFWARHLSGQISRPLMANEEVVALTRSVRAKWGNYAFESVHFMFHYPPPPAQQYPPAFLHLVTRKLNFICWASDARHIGRDAAWWSVYPRDDHITHHTSHAVSDICDKCDTVATPCCHRTESAKGRVVNATDNVINVRYPPKHRSHEN